MLRRRSEICSGIANALHHLHEGELKKVRACIREVEEHARGLSEKVKIDILDFAQQVLFAIDYDPKHLITEEIRKAADKLIRDLRKEEE